MQISKNSQNNFVKQLRFNVAQMFNMQSNNKK